MIGELSDDSLTLGPASAEANFVAPPIPPEPSYPSSHTSLSHTDRSNMPLLFKENLEVMQITHKLPQEVNSS